MAQPDLARARRHYRQQVAIANAAGVAVSGLVVRRRSWAEILRTLTAYQLAAATAASTTMAGVAGTQPRVRPEMFAGVSSAGFPISEPLVATLDYVVPAPVAPLPAPWWQSTDGAQLGAAAARLVEGIVKDTGRAAFQAELVASDRYSRYVRVLVPPSCQRCAVTAGKISHQREAFDRHPPTCDCQNWPADSWDEAHSAGLVASPQEAYARGQIRDLTEAQRQAIEAGGDISKIINANSGMQTSSRELFGHRVRATSYGTTKRSLWRKQNPTRLVRLTPQSIYDIATDDADALRLLGVYGYLG